MMTPSLLFLMLHFWPAFDCSTVHVIQSAGCTDPDLLETAKAALDKVNKNRREGYIFKLYQLYDFSENAEGKKGSSYTFSMNVVETNCHVLSRKPCGDFNIGYEVYGHCEVSVFLNEELFNHIMLQKYSCAVKKVDTPTWSCPDCPIDMDLQSNDNMEKVKLTLQEFNSNGGWLKYFAFLNVTKATKQFAFGSAYFFAYTIQETVCTKCMSDADLNRCKTEESPRVGICKACLFEDIGALKLGPTGPTLHPVIHVDCEIIEPKYLKKEPLLGSVVVLPSASTVKKLPPPRSLNCPGDSKYPIPR